jgi:DNA-binding NarL/FixJ family response regulator
VVEEFVRLSPETRTVDDRLAQLTSRELEILLLIARGMSNAEIGAELYLSDAT